MLRLALFGLFHLSHESFHFNYDSSYDICQETLLGLSFVYQRSKILSFSYRQFPVLFAQNVFFTNNYRLILGYFLNKYAK